MKIVSEKNIGNEVEVQFELDEDEYNKLYEQYLVEKELIKDSDNYTFDNYFQELMDLFMLHVECDVMENKLEQKRIELKEKEKMLRFKKDELQAKLDGNNS